MEKQIVLKARKLAKGDRIAIYPMSLEFGDLFTTYAEKCYVHDSEPIELSQPFKAIFEDFDGTFLYIRTDDQF